MNALKDHKRYGAEPCVNLVYEEIKNGRHIKMLDLSITNYLNIVNYVFLGIFTFLSLLVLHFIIVSIVGLFCNKNIQQVLKRKIRMYYSC